MNHGDRFLPLIRRRTWRDRDPLPKILREWHGDAVSRDIVRAHLPNEVHVGEALDQVLRQLISPDELRIQQLRADWAAVVGEPIARVSEPHHLHNGVLYVMVRGATMRMELSRFHVDTILARVREHSGEDFCRELRFAAEG
jgi:predicted nucleic acid-binding Zn ribbon protein